MAGTAVCPTDSEPFSFPEETAAPLRAIPVQSFPFRGSLRRPQTALEFLPFQPAQEAEEQRYLGPPMDRRVPGSAVQARSRLISIVGRTLCPRSFCQLHIVVGQQRSLFAMKIADGEIVLRQGSVELGSTGHQLSLRQ